MLFFGLWYLLEPNFIIQAANFTNRCTEQNTNFNLKENSESIKKKTLITTDINMKITL